MFSEKKEEKMMMNKNNLLCTYLVTALLLYYLASLTIFHLFLRPHDKTFNREIILKLNSTLFE